MLKRPILASAKKVASITKAVCTLHNYLMLEEFGIPNSSKRYCPQISRQGSKNYSRNAKSVQNLLTNYFCSLEGEVPWQYAYVQNNGRQEK